MLGGVEGQAAPRHLLKPAELPHGSDHAAREEGHVGEGGGGRDAGLGAHQGLREEVVLGQPPVDGVLGQRSVPHAREEGVNSGRLPRGGGGSSTHRQSWSLASVGSVEEPQFEFHCLVIQDGQAVVITSVAVEQAL